LADQVVVKATERRKGAASLLPPSDIRAVSVLLLLGGIALSLVGWLDVSLMWVSPAFGDVDWEFGTIGQTFDALPLATIGVLLLAAGLRGYGGNRVWPRALAAASLIVTLLCLGALAMFSLNVGQAFRLLNDPAAAPGLKRVIVKAIISGLVYATLYTTIAIIMWRSAGKRRAAEVTA
jgi:hypothetical protein